MAIRPIEIVQKLMDAFNARDAEAMRPLLAEDAVLENVMLDPIEGRDAIVAFQERYCSSVQSIDFRIHRFVEQGGVVATERSDDYVTGNGKQVKLLVAGFFEVEDGRIKLWRDYFDLATVQRQSS